MNYQLIALDMDGTLLDSSKAVSPLTRDAIARAIARGKEVAICSGRCPIMVEHHRADFPGVRYAICSSGATLYDLAERRVLSTSSFEKGILAQLRDLTHGLAFSPDAFCGRDFYYPAELLSRMADYGAGDYERLFRESGHPVADVWERALDESVTVEKIDLHFANHADRDVMLERAQGLPLELAYSESTTLEVSPAGATKGSGLRALAALLGVPMDETIAVGDSDNDLPMLAVAGLAVAMGNANENARRTASAVVADNDHDGCAEAIERFLLSA